MGSASNALRVFEVAPSLVGLAFPSLEALRARCGESVSLAVPDGADMVIVVHLEGPQVLRVVGVEGTRAPMHAAATGKAVLARWPEERVAALLDRTLATYTPATITDPAGLAAELVAVRARGWARMDGEWDEGVASVGAAIVDGDGAPVGGVGVSGPVQRFDAATLETFAELVCATADEISALLARRVPTEWARS